MNVKLIYAGIAIIATAAAYHVHEMNKVHNISFDAGWTGAMDWVKTNHEYLGYCPHYGAK